MAMKIQLNELFSFLSFRMERERRAFENARFQYIHSAFQSLSTQHQKGDKTQSNSDDLVLQRDVFLNRQAKFLVLINRKKKYQEMVLED